MTGAEEAAGRTDAELLLRARRQLQGLVARLETAPFAPETHCELRAFLDEEAEAAAEAFARWCALPGGARAQASRRRS